MSEDSTQTTNAMLKNAEEDEVTVENEDTPSVGNSDVLLKDTADPTQDEAGGESMTTQDRLEIEDGLRFANRLAKHGSDLALGASIYSTSLVELLIKKGLIGYHEYDVIRDKVAQDFERNVQSQRSTPHVKLQKWVDKYSLKDLPEIDCGARHTLCKAKCCSFAFALTSQDLDEGKARWDYGDPYTIRRGVDGYCGHVDKATLKCQIYENRPAICRTYSCVSDKRVWKDFDKRIPGD